jgi:hypothetical protein
MLNLSEEALRAKNACCLLFSLKYRTFFLVEKTFITNLNYLIISVCIILLSVVIISE